MLPQMKDDPLVAVVRRMAAGDVSALDMLYRQLERPLFGFIHSKLNDPFAAADILHEVFLEVWRGAAGFQDRSRVRTWVYAIAWRKVVDEFRARGRVTVQDDMPDRPDEGPSALDLLQTAEEREMLRDCLGGLKADHRAAIELTFLEDMSYREVAAVIGVPEGTVKTRVFHAKALLLRCLEAKMNRRARI
jgi:RNA polymerase sigma-70 factor, ECF subfamily